MMLAELSLHDAAKVGTLSYEAKHTGRQATKY